METVSSSALAGAAGVKPAQLRKDLTYFGQFGTRGLGYSVEELRDAIRDVLGREHLQPVVMVGAGNLGVAQEVANELVEAGVQGILNFSPTLLEVPEPVTVNNVDLALELENLSYFVTQGEESEES